MSRSKCHREKSCLPSRSKPWQRGSNEVRSGRDENSADDNNTAAKTKAKEFSAEDRHWWAFQPLRRNEPPKFSNEVWVRNDIDRFVLAQLNSQAMTPAAEADRETLIRRLSFDLIGLPPSPQEIDEFVNDKDTQAYERLVDRLLNSPRYGEHWARHWLDLVRYADSDGYRIDHYRPNAWRYRDYVINSLNNDKPYDRFMQEQLAGDEMFPESPEALIATGYLRQGIYEYNNRDVRGQWDIILNELTDTTGDVFMGLGMQCARCHDHKFDPNSYSAIISACVLSSNRCYCEMIKSPLHQSKSKSTA